VGSDTAAPPPQHASGMAYNNAVITKLVENYRSHVR
jgi:hypothetical protein